MKKPIKIEIIISDEKGSRMNSKCIDVEDIKVIKEMDIDIRFLGDGKNLHLRTVDLSISNFNTCILFDDTTSYS